MDNFCDFDITKDIKIKKKYLLSTSLFYLSDPYKNNSRYIDGLKKLIDFLKEKKNFILRIYYDNSIFENIQFKNIFNTLKNNEYVELVNYSCKKFIKNNYHFGTFGTLIRFLPIFELNDDNDNFEIIYIIDIDDSNYDYIEKYIYELQNSNKNFMFYDWKNYGDRYFNKFNNKFGNLILANIFVKDYKFNIKIFTDFLDEIYNSDKLYKEIYKINKFYFNNKNIDILFTYGVDEYFLNKCLINKLNKNQIIFSRENYYFNFYLKNLLIFDPYSTTINLYLKELISLFDQNILKKNINNYELRNILYQCINFKKNKYYNNFVKNYFIFCKEFKPITIKYYEIAYHIFNELYIDDLFDNDFCGMSWYFKKNWKNIPKQIKNKIII